MLGTDGLVKVLDFGVGLILDDIDGGPRLTSSDVTVGTARYMAPEQATQHASVTGAADLYALGCVLYEMLAGAPPFDGDSMYEILNRHVEQQPLPVRQLRGDVPEELDAVITRLLEKDPADRPGTAAEVVELLVPTALVPGPGVPGAVATRHWRWRRSCRRVTSDDPATPGPMALRTLPQPPQIRSRRTADSTSSRCTSGLSATTAASPRDPR